MKCYDINSQVLEECCIHGELSYNGKMKKVCKANCLDKKTVFYSNVPIFLMLFLTYQQVTFWISIANETRKPQFSLQSMRDKIFNGV